MVPFVAYDLETTRIKEGTPLVKYITAFGEAVFLSRRIRATKKDPYSDLAYVLRNYFITEEQHGYRFIGWNANKFDVFMVAKALLQFDDIILRPYLTRSKSLRGLKVIGIAGDLKDKEWEFLDGMAMTGLDTVGMKLKKFLDLFAPEYQKLELDFEKVAFDPTNAEHIAYAERDSEGLYRAMVKVNQIAIDLTGTVLQPTMGNLAIKYFQSQLPDDIVCWVPGDDLKAILHASPKRGGFCWIARQYEGKVWKYDINQAYAAAMRDAELPCGSCVPSVDYVEGSPGVYHCVIVYSSGSSGAPVPFYYRDIDTNEGRFSNGVEAVETWILSTEIDHLRETGWTVEVKRGYFWDGSFNMKEMVDSLERLRFSDPGGPNGPLGTMVKVVGNSAYGKTLEQLGGLELVMAKECPEGYEPFMPEAEGMENVYCAEGEEFFRPYHCPQIGCFITAHVRIIVRNAALSDHKHFIYADTDCVVYSRPVTFLDIDPKRYGAWKKESDGVDYIFIGKKVYWGADGVTHAKGLHVRHLTKADYEQWKEGKPPKQRQTQRNNFVKFIGGAEMFHDLVREGTDVTKSKQAKLDKGEFKPK